MIDLPGMAPVRLVEPRPDGSVTIHVTPPVFMRCPRVSVDLNREQYARYLEWRLGHKMIQDALPDLSEDEREKLMTGLGPADFARLAAEPEEEAAPAGWKWGDPLSGAERK
jgi:hypothetical protein